MYNHHMPLLIALAVDALVVALAVAALLLILLLL